MFAWRFCIANNRALKLLQADLRRVQKEVERLHRVQKGFEQCKNGLVHATKGY